MKNLISSVWRKARALHPGLYVIFLLMVWLGTTAAFVVERYALADTALVRSQWSSLAASQEAGHGDALPLEMVARILKLPVRKVIADDGSGKTRTEIRHISAVSNFYFLFIALWLLPLYRYRFGGGTGDLRRIESRIVNLPMVVFALGWVIALQHCAESMALYAHGYGLNARAALVFVVSSLLLGTFAGYLNLEVTGLYIRRNIAGPFFKENNPHGLKRGLAASLTTRYALMMFSLGVVPVLFFVYVLVSSNAQALQRIAALKTLGKDSLLMSYDNVSLLVTLLLMAAVALAFVLFQVFSVLLYRQNVQKPVSALVRRMRAVAAGDFGCKTSVLYADELGQLKGHFNLMLDGLQEREKIKDTFGRYVSMEIAEKIMKSGKVNLAGEEIQATVLFSDIRGFTPLSEKLPPAELIRFLNDYFSHVTRPITANRGVINKFIGDAVMAVFSPVFGVEDHREAALRAALGMREALAEFNALGHYPAVNFGVGVHSGGLVAGNVGTEERLEYTVIGDTVNVASRIESQTKSAGCQLLFSEAALQGVDRAAFPGAAFTECPPVIMKGKSRPMVLYKVEPAGKP